MGLVEGKVALVTGGASGIGRASALGFAREGARVVVSDLDQGGGEKTAAAIRDAGGEAFFVAADVAVEGAVRKLVDATLSRFGRLDCAHNNAGITGPVGLLHDVALADWNTLISVNLTGVFLCLKHEIPVMLRQGGGAIVNTSSGAGLVGTPALGPYCAAKHGVLGLTRTAALENARAGIRVNAICPGATDTPMLQGILATSPGVEQMVRSTLPGGRLGTPEEIAEAVVWLCSNRASYVSGSAFLVDAAALSR
jgi:NAD(P)-dependent dehydrogenase (short-subunit alcohol dehydrogenase family)